MTKACCVTGHRELSEDKIGYITAELRKQIIEAIEDGYTLFISGFAKGTDMIFARIVIDLKEKYPDINLEAALPYPTWMKNRSKADLEILGKCVGVGVHSKEYSRDCFLIRNRFMVTSSERVIAVYDGRKGGGTVSTIRYAHVLERDLRTIEI